MDAYAKAARAIHDEAESARAKFAPFNSAHEGYAVIAEELDELWDDIKANRKGPDIAEAIQVGAMALRYIADMTAKRAGG
jgi:hypothetical protein